MATNRVEAFYKVLSIDADVNQYASVILKFERNRDPVRYDFRDSEIAKFNALVHMLENDVVYYDTRTHIFFSEKEFRKPSSPEPLT